MAANRSRLFLAFAACAALALAGCSSSGSSTSTGGAETVKADPRAATKSRSDEPIHKVERFTVHADIARASRTGEVYLLRGLMDIFSRGMDEMAAKINRAGVYALSTSYSNWREIADEIIARNGRGEVSHPVIIMGHSLGGNDAPKMATYLGRRGVRVAYVATFDPTEPSYVGKNIGKVVNYYLPNDNNRVYRSAGFTGTLDNVNVTRMGVSHTTIEKSPSLQNRAISQVMALTKPRRLAKK
jgi:hypothetical protein